MPESNPAAELLREGEFHFGGDPEFRYVAFNILTGQIEEVSASSVSPGGSITTDGMSHIGEWCLRGGQYGASKPYFKKPLDLLNYFADITPVTPDREAGGIFSATCNIARQRIPVDSNSQIGLVSPYPHWTRGAGCGGHVHVTSHPAFVFRPISYAIIPFWLGVATYCFDKGRFDTMRHHQSYGKWGETRASPSTKHSPHPPHFPEIPHRYRCGGHTTLWGGDKSTGYEYRSMGTYAAPTNQVYRDIIAKVLDTCIEMDSGTFTWGNNTSNNDKETMLSVYAPTDEETTAMKFIATVISEFMAQQTGESQNVPRTLKQLKHLIGEQDISGHGGSVIGQLTGKAVGGRGGGYGNEARDPHMKEFVDALASVRSSDKFINYTQFDWLLFGEFKEPKVGGKVVSMLKERGARGTGQLYQRKFTHVYDLNPQHFYTTDGRLFRWIQPTGGLRSTSGAQALPPGDIRLAIEEASRAVRYDPPEIIMGEYLCSQYNVNIHPDGLELEHIVPEAAVMAAMVAYKFNLTMPPQPVLQNIIGQRDEQGAENVPFAAETGFSATRPLVLCPHAAEFRGSALTIGLRDGAGLALRRWFRAESPEEAARVVAAYILYKKGILVGRLG
jgi:hypothetical protein